VPELTLVKILRINMT